MNTSLKRLTPCLVVGALLLTLVSCASVSIVRDSTHATSNKPKKIYVAGFDTNHGEFNVDRTGQELVDFKQNLQLMLKSGMVADITSRLIFADLASNRKGKGPENAWLIHGTFTKVNQGSRLLRSTIGFGAGGTKVETKVFVYDLQDPMQQPFMVFSTTGGSGAEPGAVVGLTMDPLQLAIGAVSGVAHGLSEDTKRTAREITAELSDYMYKAGWIPKDKWIKPKTTSSNQIP